MESFELNLKNSVSRHFVYHNLINSVVEKVKAIPKYELLKNDLELVLLVCNVIENIITKKDDVNKKELCTDVMCAIFNLSQEEIDNIKNHVQFLFDNNRIKKIKLLRQKIPMLIGAWFTKKFL